MPKIRSITSHKVLNSRGDWTIETQVVLDDGSRGVQVVPEGASKGQNEAICLPAEKAADVVSSVINDALVGEEAYEQGVLDQVMIQMDGTPNKSHLGGNSILSVSLAISKACAVSRKLELYEYLSELYFGKVINKEELVFPVPLFNVINGGKHASNGLSFQEFMVIPSKAMAYDKALELGVSVYHTLKEDLKSQNYDVQVGDEGGFAPDKLTAGKALEFLKKAAEKDFIVGEEVFFGMDAAAESFYSQGKYNIKEEDLELDNRGLLDYYTQLINKYQIIYLEDPFYEKDIEGWSLASQNLMGKTMIVADDLVVTNEKFLDQAINKKLANTVIIKPNQVGTLTETLGFIRKAKKAGMNLVVSHRSGDTGEDTFIADLALGVKADFLKSGAPVRGERVVKYNRVLDVYGSL